MKSTDLLARLASIASDLDRAGMNKEADIVDSVISKLANQRASFYIQKDPKSGAYRGIVEHIDENATINFVPEQPIIDRNLDRLKAKLMSLVPGLKLEDKGIGEPWVAESNMPFDPKGNRVA